jgi:rSAM/selenodomain-associated transferase 2/rSAM/selenodomain-associated transferase 1
MGAAELQRRLTEQCLAVALSAKVAPVEFCYAGADRTRVQRWLRRFKVEVSAQIGTDLGRRMYGSIKSALDQGCRQVVLVGTDIPGMHAGHLRAAFDALSRCDLVVGPSRDGGYWLVGMRKAHDVFHGIDWGSPQVLDQTLAAAHRLGISATRLDTLDDVDRPQDLAALPADLARICPSLSVVIPALNEADRILAAIEQVRGIDAQVIVVDGGSGDRTADLARRSGALVLQTARGRARQQNLGARKATGRVLLFLHADTRLPPDFRTQIFDLLMDPEVILGAFHLKTSYCAPGMRWIEKAANLRAKWLKMPYGDQAIFLRRAVFERAGGFDPVPIAEDLYLARRLAKMGRVALAPGTVLTSGRRWRAMGILRATLINYMIAAGCLAGIDPARLAPLYTWPKSQAGTKLDNP